MKVAVDIGNSNVLIGIHDGAQWRYQWRMITRTGQDAAYYYEVELRNRIFEHGVDTEAIDSIILSSVVPILKPIFKDLLGAIFGCEVIVLGPAIYDAINFKVPRPYEIGTDLVANAYSAFIRYQKDCIVVDFGTALTFTTVSVQGIVQGVAIAPGIKTAMTTLASNTAQLPEIPLELPDSVLGQNTTHAIQAGILWGYVGMTKELIAKIREEVGNHYVAIATGGLSFVIKPLKEEFFEINPDLTLNGLIYILERLK